MIQYTIRLPRDEREAPYLSDAEKQMTAQQLYLFWKRCSALLRRELGILQMKDDIPFTDLTPAEKNLPRNQVKDILYSRRNHEWNLLEIKKGRKTYLCNQCGKWHREGVLCHLQRFPARRGQEAQNVLLQTDGRAITLRPAPDVDDIDAMIAEQTKIEQRIAAAVRQKKQAEELGQQIFERDERRRREQHTEALRLQQEQEQRRLQEIQRPVACATSVPTMGTAFGTMQVAPIATQGGSGPPFF